MLTRESTRIEWTEDVDWDARMAMTDADIAAEDAEFDRECLTWEREHQAKLARLTTLQRYRYERHNLLVSLLRCRVRIDNYRDWGIDFLVPKQLTMLKDRQTALVGWRHFLRTGIAPSETKQ